MSQATFSELILACERQASGEVSAHIPANWMQGRTTYGGLSAALCLRAVQLNFDDLPPLRSALITFVGPVGGTVTMQCKVLRQGKSVSNIQVDMLNEQGHATQAIFCFGAQRESRFDQVYNSAPSLPSPEASADFFIDINQAPVFARNFDTKLAKGGHPISGSSEHEHFIWVRHHDQQANDITALIGIADMPPPAVLPMFKKFAPISSMTWMLNFTNTNVNTENGWWLMRTAAEHARHGYSSQDMQVWNRQGELVITGRQSVAVFY